MSRSRTSDLTPLTFADFPADPVDSQRHHRRPKVMRRATRAPTRVHDDATASDGDSMRCGDWMASNGDGCCCSRDCCCCYC